MFRALAAVAVVLVVSSSSYAQVMYQPVKSQFSAGCGDQHYHYGGVDGRVHAMMRHACKPYGYATNLHRFDGGNSFGQPSPIYDRTVVLTDCIPFADASRFGFTAADAHNEAYANAPRYFRKADQLAGGIPTADGALIVPATVPLHVGPVMPYRSTSMMPKRGQVIIIPKTLLDKKLKDLEKPPVKVAVSE